LRGPRYLCGGGLVTSATGASALKARPRCFVIVARRPLGQHRSATGKTAFVAALAAAAATCRPHGHLPFSFFSISSFSASSSPSSFEPSATGTCVAGASSTQWQGPLRRGRGRDDRKARAPRPMRDQRRSATSSSIAPASSISVMRKGRPPC
jgi:hypothetical protein